MADHPERRNLVSAPLVWSLLNWSSILHASEAACEMSLSENTAITTVDALWLAILPLKTTWGMNELLYTYWQCAKIVRCRCAVSRDFDIRKRVLLIHPQLPLKYYVANVTYTLPALSPWKQLCPLDERGHLVLTFKNLHVTHSIIVYITWVYYLHFKLVIIK